MADRSARIQTGELVYSLQFLLLMDAGCTSSIGQCGGGAADGADPAT